MEWQSIGYVSSGFTLVAFIVAAGVWTYRKVLLQKQWLIRQAPEQDRARLVENTLEFFNVDTSGLTKQEKYQIVMKQINARAVRFKITALVVVIIACLATGVSIYALSRDRRGAGETGDPTPAQTSTPIVSATPKPTPVATFSPRLPTNSNNTNSIENKNGSLQSPSPESSYVMGYVFDDESKERIPGAEVSIVKFPNLPSVKTDSNGLFTMNIPRQTGEFVTVVVRMRGYVEKPRDLGIGLRPENIYLKKLR